LAERIGYAHSDPHILRGTLGDNIFLPFKNKPNEVIDVNSEFGSFRANAELSGNSLDEFNTDWVDPSVAGLHSTEEIRDWWFELVEAMGSDDFMVRRALRSQLESKGHKKLTDAIVRLRPEIAMRITDAGLDDIVHGFHPDKFNPVSPLGSNLLYAVPTRALTQVSLSEDQNFVRVIRKLGIVNELVQMSA